jgi:hypothetical protein
VCTCVFKAFGGLGEKWQLFPPQNHFAQCVHLWGLASMPTCQWLLNAAWWVVAHDVYNAGMAPNVGVFSEDLAEMCMFSENSAKQAPLIQRTAVQPRV